MADATRERVTFELGGQEYTVVPDFGVIDRIESAQNRPSLMQLAEDLERGHVRFSDMAVIIHAATAEAGYRATYRDIGEAAVADAEGAGNAVAAIVSALFDTGEKGERQQGKSQAAAKGKGGKRK
jgi:hypothetical protein